MRVLILARSCPFHEIFLYCARRATSLIRLRSGETASGMIMSLDVNLRRRLEQSLSVVDERDGRELRGPRLVDDAQRLWRRVRHFVDEGLVTAGPDMEALEVACYALQLPARGPRAFIGNKPPRMSLRDRAEQSAELLAEVLNGFVDESLLDRAIRLLQETPQNPPVLEDAKLLADSVNLDDFGIIGFVQQVHQAARQGEGLSQLADGLEKREQYGYWDARLKDGFHFEPVRQIAAKRLEHLRQLAEMLHHEIVGDGPA